MTKTVVHNTAYRVRYSDTDNMGVVYYGNYFRLFEIGRTELLRHSGIPYSELEASGYYLPVLEAHAEYHRPARYDEELNIVTSYTPEYGPSISISYFVQKNDEILVSGWTRHIFVSASTFKPIRPPKRFIEAFEIQQKRTTV